MSTITPYCPPPPTWRLCHPVNIYVYQNGLEGERPTLVHIPMENKKNMSTVLEAIGTRMKLPVGYPVGLYHMDGTRVCKTYELEMYNNYVVVTNLEKRFKCVDYGKIREPLVVIGSRYSKHVNTLRLQNKKFDLFCRRKMARKPLHELMANTGEQDGYGPGEIPGGKPCGQLCHKVTPRRDRVAQCCSDEIMCVEGAAMDLEGDRCRDYERAMEAEVQCEAPPGTKEDEDCKLVEELKEKVRQQSGEVRGGGGSLAGNLKDLMLRYRDVGSDIFRMFQDKICKDLEGEEGERRVSQRWEIPGGSNLSLETQQRLKEELIKLAGQSCQFAFDKFGNFVGSEGCKVPGGMSDAGVVTEESRAMEGMLEGMRRMSGGSRRTSLQQTEGQGGGGWRESFGGGGGGERRQNEEEVGKRASFQEVEVGRLEVEMVDEENNISTGSIPGLTKVESEKRVGIEEEEETRVQVGGGFEEEMEVKKRVSGMQEEITEIVGNLRRSLVLSRSNSQNAGVLPVGMASLAKEAKKLEAVLEEMEEEEEENGEEEQQQLVKQVKSTGSNKSGRSEKSGRSLGQNSKRASQKQGGDPEENEEEEEETNVFSLIMQSRNPWREGDMAGVGVPPLAGRLNKNRLDKLFSENPFRRYWFHEEEMFKDEPIKEEDPFLRKIQPPEEFNWPVPPPPSVPPHPQESDVFSVHGSRTEWWPNRQPDVFLQQINELVQRYDNTKATSPPPPPAPAEEIPLNSKLFTVGPSPRRNSKKSVACGQSKTEVKSPPKHRNVCAQAGEDRQSPPEVNFEEISNHRKEKKVEELWPKKNYSGGTQTRIILKELPSEDEKPAGMYEGYQESIKSHLSEEENDGDDERRVYYRKRREKTHKGILKPSGRRRLKRKEHFLHPCTVYSPDEEELQEEDDKQLSPRGGDNKQQGVQWVISTNPGGYPQVYLTQGLQNTQFGGQQPFLVQTTPTLGATFPVIARHSTEVTPAQVLKPGQMQLPLVQFTQQSSSSSSPLLRQPIMFTGASSPQQKYLPMINPNMRLVRLVQAPQQFQQQQPVHTTSLISASPPQGPLQNKLVQMMMTPPQLQSLVLQQHQQPQQQQLTQPSPPQFIFKP